MGPTVPVWRPWEKRKISCPCRELDHDSSAVQSLYQLECFGSSLFSVAKTISFPLGSHIWQRNPRNRNLIIYLLIWEQCAHLLRVGSLKTRIFIYLFIYLFIHLFIYLFIYLYIYLFIYLFIYLYIYLFIYLFTAYLDHILLKRHSSAADSYLFIYLFIYLQFI